jgi:DNA-binding beta-propeller fold protein YncE
MRRVVIACLFVGACAKVPSARAPSLVAEPESPIVVPVSCARRTQGSRPVAVSTTRQGSAVALARAGDKLLAYVADADSRSVHTVDVDEGRELVRTRVDGEPRQILVLPDGRLVVSLSDGSHIAVLEPGDATSAPLTTICEREVPAEPWGLALSTDDAKLVVTSAWGSALTVLDAATLEVKRIVPLPRDPRGVLVDDAGMAFVGHLVGGKMSVVDLGEGRGSEAPVSIDLGVRKSTPLAQPADRLAKRTGSQGYALVSVALPAMAGVAAEATVTRRILVPMVSVDPGDPERRSSVYYGPPFDGIAKQTPTVGVVDPESRQPLSKYVLGTSETTYARECLLPRAAAVRVHGKTPSLLVACFGIDAVLELDALTLDPFRAERRRFAVPPGPEGIAVDDASGRAVVFSQLGAALTVLGLDGAAGATRTIPLDYHPDPALAAAARGRVLFYRTDDTGISGDGIACSSCHLDGREDGLTWTTPMGPRQTPMLAGRLAGTAPYGWEGDRATVAGYIANTVERLGGKGLKAEDVDDLAVFLGVLKAPSRPRPDAALASRGRELFEDAAQGCGTCHVGGATDAKVHGFSPTAKDIQTSFDTPSLEFIGGTAPYFHDGRYATLEALLADPESSMGHSASLPAEDRAALAAYLRSL